MKYASVILDISIQKRLDYAIPEPLLPKAYPGVRVKVLVRGSLRYGYIFEIKDEPEVTNVSTLLEIVTDYEMVSPELFQLALWMSKYYATPLEKVMKSIIPAPLRKQKKHKEQFFVMRAKSREQLREACVKMRNHSKVQAEILDLMLQVKKGMLLTELLEKTKGSRSSVQSLVKKGLLQIDIIRIHRSPIIDEEYFKTKSKSLNEEQKQAFDAIFNTLNQQKFHTHLLFGVTGSGKTEIYLQAIEKALAMNRGAIVLVPEISLTTHLIERFRSRFDNQIALLHHRLSQGERFDEWHRIRKGEAKISMGARSCLFSPVKNLGLIIVDEEHEASYKQTDEMPCYHARDVAVMRGKLTNSTVILGSATPSLESYTNALSGKYHLHQLSLRADSAKAPKVTVIDMRKEDQKAKRVTYFSEALLNGIEKRRENGEQSILFLNRRGYHTSLLCEECHSIQKCPHCDLSLAFHKGEQELRCHICHYNLSPPPKICSQCKSCHTLKFKGFGTEHIEKAIHAIFPEIRTIRMDADTTRHKGSHQQLLRNFGSGKADLLIGTQMIAKGLHFPEVTLVGVINADMGLNIPDFRASETLFQLITQVSGRAGRGILPGEVIIQTRMPEQSLIQHAIRQNYPSFYNDESNSRKLFGYPPFGKLAKFTFVGKNDKETEKTAEEFRQELTFSLPPSFELYPVTPCGYAKVKDQYRYQFLIKGNQFHVLHQKLEKSISKSKKIKMTIDIDPINTFF